MTHYKTRIACCSLALSLSPLLAGIASAATSFSNALTGFTGDSTQGATQTEVMAAGFNFFSTQGLTEDPPGNFFDPTVVFDTEGAKFGSLFGGDGGRNYVRTNDSDYATVDFVAEITFVAADLDVQDVFIGLGAGDTALFGWPDWSTQFSSVMLTPEINVDPFMTTMYTHNDTPTFANNPAPGMGSGTHRLRLTFDNDAKTADFAIDLDYTGDEFASDIAAATVDVSTLFAEAPSPPTPGDYNSNGEVDAADYTIWRDTLGSTTDLRANGNNAEASADLIDEADYVFWQERFGDVGVGWPTDPSRIFFGGDDGVIFKDFSVTVAAGAVSGSSAAVPEPASLVMMTIGLMGMVAARKQSTRSLEL